MVLGERPERLCVNVAVPDWEPRVEVDTPVESAELVLYAKPLCVALAPPVAVIEPDKVAPLGEMDDAELVVIDGAESGVYVMMMRPWAPEPPAPNVYMPGVCT